MIKVTKVKLIVITSVVVLFVVLGAYLYNSKNYSEVYTDVVNGEKVYYEEIDVEINGIGIDGFYKLGSLEGPSIVAPPIYYKNQMYIVNDELEIITIYPLMSYYSGGIEKAILESAISKLIYQYYSDYFNDLNNYISGEYESLWNSEFIYERVSYVSIHPNISEYIQLDNYIYSECLTDDEISVVVDAMANNNLDINENQKLYNLIENNLYELLTYGQLEMKNRIGLDRLETFTSSNDVIEQEDSKEIVPVRFNAFVISMPLYYVN